MQLDWHLALFPAAVECPDSGLSCSWLLWNALTVVCPVPESGLELLYLPIQTLPITNY